MEMVSESKILLVNQVCDKCKKKELWNMAQKDKNYLKKTIRINVKSVAIQKIIRLDILFKKLFRLRHLENRQEMKYDIAI